ncbi:MAG: hypothetical protein ABGZ17_02390 [Planctomycetaceae bacterium]
MSTEKIGPNKIARSMSQQTGQASSSQTGRASMIAITVDENGKMYTGNLQILTTEDKSLMKAMELQKKEIAKAFRVPFSEVHCGSEAEFRAYLNPVLANWKDARAAQTLAEYQGHVAEHVRTEVDMTPIQADPQNPIPINTFDSTAPDELAAGQRTHESWDALKASDDFEIQVTLTSENNPPIESGLKQLNGVLINKTLPLKDLVHVPCHAGGHCALIALAASQGLSQGALESKMDTYEHATAAEIEKWKELKTQVRNASAGIILDELRETHFFRATGIPEITQISIHTDANVSLQNVVPKQSQVPRSQSHAEIGHEQTRSVAPPVVLIWRNGHFDLLTTADWALKHRLPTNTREYVEKAVS